MKIIALCFSLILFLIIFAAILRTTFERRFPYVRPFVEDTRQAYILLALAAIATFAWARLDLRNWHLESLEIAGVKASVGELKQKVETLSEQMEIFFKRKRIESFDTKNWNRVRTVKKSREGVVLEVTLEEEPIPGSVEVYQGVLIMPEEDYRIDGRTVQFPAATDSPVNAGLTVKYYPRKSH